MIRATTLLAVLSMTVRSVLADAGSISTILDVFPPAEVVRPDEEQGETMLVRDFAPSGSMWVEGIDERNVFLAELIHRQGEHDSFNLRVGKGGQIYSLRGPFGESVPPQWRQPDARSRSPWNDEVWQFVAVCSRYNGLKSLLAAGAVSDEVQARFRAVPFKTSFFIHNSGAYIPADSGVRDVYCPLLAMETDAERRSIRTLNWGLVPQVRTIHRSPLLYYFEARDVGEGIIELTWVVHNFSMREDVVFDHLNAPWGGTRRTSLPELGIASPAGQLQPREVFFKKGIAAVDVRETGGWSLASVTDADDSPSLALVFGRDRHLELEREKAKRGEPHCQVAPSLYRAWLAGDKMYDGAWQDWQTRPENSFRNYDVAVVIPKLRLAPQSTIWYRSFLVVNRRDKAVEQARSLVDKVDYGLLTFDPAATPLLPVHVKDGRIVEPAMAEGTPTFEVYAKPVPGSQPLFLIEDEATGREVVTTDPYFFVPQEPVDLGVPADHPHHDYYASVRGISLDRSTCRWKRLLGYALREPPAGASYAPLSRAAGPDLFPQTNEYHIDVWVRITPPQQEAAAP